MGKKQPEDFDDFDELDDTALDAIVGGDSPGKGFGVQFNVTAGIPFIPGAEVSGSLAFTNHGVFASGGGLVGGGFNLSADAIVVNPTAGHTVSDVMTGPSYGGDFHVGPGLSYFNSPGSGSVAGFGAGLGLSGGATYGVSLQGPIAETTNAIHSAQDGAVIQYGLTGGFGDPNLGTAQGRADYVNAVRDAFPSATSMSDHAIQSTADFQAVQNGLLGGRITDTDVQNLGVAGAAAIVRESDYVANDPHAVDDHGFHDASPDGSNGTAGNAGNVINDQGDVADHGFHDASPDGSNAGNAGSAGNAGNVVGDQGDVADHGFHDASPDGSNAGNAGNAVSDPGDTSDHGFHDASPSGDASHASDNGFTDNSHASDSAPAPASAPASTPTDPGDTSDHGFHNASPDGTDNGNAVATTPSNDFGGNDGYAGSDFGGGDGGGGGDFGGGGGDDA